jgi:PadR family transcriptional regulator PadR
LTIALTLYRVLSRVRVTHQTKLILQVMLDAPTEEIYGFAVAQASGVAGGVVYPILRRLEDEGWVTSYWEDIDEAGAGRRRRRYYRLTGDGRRAARECTAPERKALQELVPGWST